MSGICGIVLRDSTARLAYEHVAPLTAALEPHGAREGKVAAFGSAAFGARAFPGRSSGVVEEVINGRTVALALYGSLFEGAPTIPTTDRVGEPCLALLHLYLKEGMAFLKRLRGDFALAVWDGRHDTLSLAADHFRIQPLFYYVDREKLVFGSRMRSLRACPLPLQLSVDPAAVVQVVASSVVPTPGTIFREVKKIPPGHVLTYRNGNVGLSPYWTIDFRHPSSRGARELARDLRSAFSEAVSVRLNHDKPSRHIGTYLSGGIDSSTVTGVLTQLAGPVQSFTVGFGEQRFDETHYARVAAAAFGSPNKEYIVGPQDVVASIPLLLDAFDEPFANASAVPAYYCARMARENGIEVLYAGDGGDELFAGNERYAVQRLFGYYDRLPLWFRQLLLEPVVFAMAGARTTGYAAAAKRYLLRAREPSPRRLSSYGFFRLVPITEFFTDDLLGVVRRDYDPYGPVSFHYHRAPAQNELDRQLYVDLLLAISDNDLPKINRTAEAAGVLVRYPFLDHRLAEFAASIPSALKMRGRELRSFFKDAYSDLLPMETRQKKKHGFGLPIPVWLRTDRHLNDMMNDLLLGPTSVRRGYVRRDAIEQLLELHRSDETSFYGTVLWHLMVLELWLQRNLD